MPRYKPYSYAQGKFIAIHFDSQILPGTFEYALNHLIDHELDLSVSMPAFVTIRTERQPMIPASCSRSCSMLTPAG